jgi:hypothetical protein
LKDLYVELCDDDSSINFFYDSQSAIYLTKDQMFHERSKHIDVKYHYVRDMLAQCKMKVCKISTHDNPADITTKPVHVAMFELCSSLLRIMFSPSGCLALKVFSLLFRQKSTVHDIRRNFSQGGVFYIVNQILLQKKRPTFDDYSEARRRDQYRPRFLPLCTSLVIHNTE